MTYDQRSAYRDGSLGRLMRQPGSVNEGTLGALMRQPGAFADGTLGALMRQPGSYSDGSLGVLMKQPGSVSSGVFGDITRPTTGLTSLNPFAPSPAAMAQAAAHAAAEAAARANAPTPRQIAYMSCMTNCKKRTPPQYWSRCSPYCSSPMQMRGLGELTEAAAGLGAVKHRPRPWRFARRSPFSMAAAARQVRAAVPHARVSTSGLGAIPTTWQSWALIAGGVALVATVGYVATRK